MKNLRMDLGKKLRRPVGDDMWIYMDEMGWVFEAGDQQDPVGYLAEKLQSVEAAARSMRHEPDLPIDLHGPRDAAALARIDALSAIYAAWAQHDTSVLFFRRSALVRDKAALLAHAAGQGPYPEYQLLAETEVESWIVERFHAASETGDGDKHIAELVSESSPGRPSPVIDLQYFCGGTARVLTVERRADLGDLATLSEKLADHYRWHPGHAAMFVLTGAPPTVSTYSASAQVRHSTNWGMYSTATTRVTVTLDLFMPPRLVAELFADLRSRFQPHPAKRALSLKHYRLAQHAGPHVYGFINKPAEVALAGRPPKGNPANGLASYIRPGADHTWKELWQTWNDRFGDCGEDGRPWRYNNVSNFTRDCQRAIINLLDPGWQTPPQPPVETSATADQPELHSGAPARTV